MGGGSTIPWFPGLRLVRTYRREWLASDRLAGLSVAAVALPGYYRVSRPEFRHSMVAMLGVAESIPFMDITGAEALESLRGELAGRGTVLAIARAKGLFRAMLERTGVAGRIGTAHFFPTVHAGVQAFLAGLRPRWDESPIVSLPRPSYSPRGKERSRCLTHASCSPP